MFFWPKSTLRLQGILLAVGVSFKSYYLCFNIHTYTHNPNLCFLLFSQWLHVAGGLRLWNSLEISVRKVFLLHLWLNSPQELQVSLCLLGQEEALTWGGFEPGKQRDRQDRAPCIHSYMCSEHFFFFPDVLCKRYLSLLGNRSILEKIGGSPGHCQAPRWGGGSGGLAEHPAGGHNTSTLTLYVLDIFAKTFE